ncbi:TSUP family transporter [Demequina sp. SYSU T00192]|uniref:Probable membrane transporter protein n=1 Tax=Demequina litoralis TaxID=3051660 RepID=A0ABT8G8T6_9MICO|nr:TSUP family transporter [Demequina sp. SYSU T00192]MDN4475555.1 TSUP family transporter [Demequina sp. SYSU T00192]
MTAAAWLAAGAVVALATVVQSATGMGFGIVAVPLLVLVAPQLGIGAVLAITVVVMIVAAWSERRWLHRGDLMRASVAAVPGIVAGTLIAHVTPAAATQVVVGAVVVAASALSLLAWRARMTPASVAVAGGLGGALTPIAALPGPPMAVVYRPDEVRTMRATLSAYFAVTSVLSLISLSLSAGRAGAGPLGLDALAGLALAPAVIVGAVAAAPLVRRIPAGAVRTAALILSLVSGAVLAARGIVA